VTAIRDEPGPIADEAARLAQAFVHWARDTAARLDLGSLDHVATGAPECAVCPICQAIGMVRGDAAATERIAAIATHAATAVAGVLRSVFEGHSHPSEPRVDPIDIDDVHVEGDE
jgi:hypothetical protein